MACNHTWPAVTAQVSPSPGADKPLLVLRGTRSSGHSLRPGTSGSTRKRVKEIIFCALTSLPMGDYKANLVVTNEFLRDLWPRCAGSQPNQVTRTCPPRKALGWSLITVRGHLGHSCDSTGDLLPFQAQQLVLQQGKIWEPRSPWWSQECSRSRALLLQHKGSRSCSEIKLSSEGRKKGMEMSNPGTGRGITTMAQAGIGHGSSGTFTT